MDHESRAMLLHTHAQTITDFWFVSCETMRKHLWSSGYEVSLTGRQLDPGQVYHLTKPGTQTLIGAATK